MERSHKPFPALFLLVLLLVASGMAPAVQGRQCESKSRTFQGLCLLDSNCANACKTEGFLDGKCHGLRRRCFCTKSCDAYSKHCDN